MARSPLPTIPSPCVSICTLHPVTGACLGCLRTADEIARWPRASNEERLEILEELKQRRRAMGRTSAADQRPRRRRKRPGQDPGGEGI